MAPIEVISGLASRRVIYAAISGDLLIGQTKLSVAAWTGSSSMLSEGVHSIVDTGTGFLLIYGLHRSAARADIEHPLGYGRELYFWSFVVAVLLFAFGAGISALFDGTTWWLALRNFRGERRNSEIIAAIRESKDPPSFMVLFEDSAALASILIAVGSIYLSVRLDMPIPDGAGSILIGLILGVTAWLLLTETKPCDRRIGRSRNRCSHHSYRRRNEWHPSHERRLDCLSVTPRDTGLVQPGIFRPITHPSN